MGGTSCTVPDTLWGASQMAPTLLWGASKKRRIPIHKYCGHSAWWVCRNGGVISIPAGAEDDAGEDKLEANDDDGEFMTADEADTLPFLSGYYNIADGGHLAPDSLIVDPLPFGGFRWNCLDTPPPHPEFRTPGKK